VLRDKRVVGDNCAFLRALQIVLSSSSNGKILDDLCIIIVPFCAIIPNIIIIR
jgi:hypothetical protein